jgi:hypothetical protein
LKGLAAPTPIDFIDALLLLPPAFSLSLSVLSVFWSVSEVRRFTKTRKKMSTFLLGWLSGEKERETEGKVAFCFCGGVDTVKVTSSLVILAKAFALTVIFTVDGCYSNMWYSSKPFFFLFFYFCVGKVWPPYTV